MKSKIGKIISWICQIIAAVILAQTLYFKFTAHPESVQLFTELGMEPQGRILIGVIELVAALLLVIGASAHWGALLAVGTMAGAIIGHFTHLGWDGTRGELGALAVLVFLAGCVVMYLRRMSFPFLKIALEDKEPTDKTV